eukprot:g31569.t1
MLAFIAQFFEYRSGDVMLTSYRILVRPLLEYCVEFWLLRSRKDIIKLKRVQKRFTRMLPGVECLSYEEQMDKLGLLSLERRRLTGDLMEVYKIMRGVNKVNGRCLFPR